MRGVRKRASTHGWVRAGRRGRLNRRPIDPARRRAERGGRSFVRRRRRRRRRRHRPVAETRRGPNVEHPIGPTRSDPIQPPRDERARSTTTDGVRAIPSASRAVVVERHRGSDAARSSSGRVGGEKRKTNESRRRAGSSSERARRQSTTYPAGMEARMERDIFSLQSLVRGYVVRDEDAHRGVRPNVRPPIRVPSPIEE